MTTGSAPAASFTKYGGNAADESPMNQPGPEHFHGTFTEAFNSGSVEPLLSLYEPDASLVPRPGEIVTDHVAVGAALRKFQAVGEMTAETRYCIQSGDVALASARWRIHGTGPDGQPVEVQGTPL